MLDEIPLPEKSVSEGVEGHALRMVVGWGWLVGIPAMFAVSVFVIYMATNSMIWTLLVDGWGAVVAGPYFGGFVLINRGELAVDHEADLDHLTTPVPA